MVPAGVFDAGAGAPALLNDTYGKKDTYGAGSRAWCGRRGACVVEGHLWQKGHLWCRRAGLVPAPARLRC